MGSISFVCPACKQGLEKEDSAYFCAHCARRYPVLFGIADFRLRSDRYLNLEDERGKARRLDEFAQTSSFEELLVYYYSITDDVPKEMATRYLAYAKAAPERGVAIVSALGPIGRPDCLIDAGCGTGGLLLAASSHFGTVVGVDIALRWLVICRKRLAEHAVEATLVCADVENLPFAEGSFTHAVAADLVENVYNPDNAIAEIAKHLRSPGKLWLSATNKYCLGPHPLVRIWALGYLPKPLRRRLVMRVRGLNLLRYINLVSPLSIAARCRARGLQVVWIGPLRAGAGSLESYPSLDRLLISLYRAVCTVRALRFVLVLVGPAFEMHCRKP